MDLIEKKDRILINPSEKNPQVLQPKREKCIQNIYKPEHQYEYSKSNSGGDRSGQQDPWNQYFQHFGEDKEEKKHFDPSANPKSKSKKTKEPSKRFKEI